MAKFVIECPNCGTYAQASSGLFGMFFGTKEIVCANRECGNKITVKTDSISSKVCAHCGNNVVYDQRKGDSAVCPVCKKAVNTTADMHRMSEFKCPKCGCTHNADNATESYQCTICDEQMHNVQNLMHQHSILSSGLASVHLPGHTAGAVPASYDCGVLFQAASMGRDCALHSGIGI